MSHSNISLFVPHIGCGGQCTFCNQRHITGHSKAPNGDDVRNAVLTALNSDAFDSKDGEIAFFGGSFTAIDRSYMLELLSSAKAFVDDGSVSGIRISTRPDCIDVDVLNILKEYGVTAIELGAQSMRDSVLKNNKRGHTAQDVVNASRLIKEFGFKLGLQMMTGLYTSSFEDDLYTAEQIIALSPDTVRIYPTITIKNTELESLFRAGTYKPQNLNDAAEQCALLLDLFDKKNIKVIRLGLHTISEEAYVAGPWHPAFRELCESIRFRNKVLPFLKDGSSYEISVSPKYLSKALGQKKSNISYFNNKNIFVRITSDNSLTDDKFIVKEVK